MTTRSKQPEPTNYFLLVSKKIHSLIDSVKHHGLIPLLIFLVLALPTGLFFAFNVPAMWAPDGGAHVARVFQIAGRGIRPFFINHERGIGYGGNVPLNVIDLKNLELTIVSSDGAPGREAQSKLLTPQDKVEIAQINSQKIAKQSTLISFVNTAAYSPVAYAPNLFGVLVGKLLNFNLGHTLLLAGLCGLFTYILCVGYALFTIRKSQLKWAVMTVSLLPVVIFQASLITADSFLMSISILFSALIIKAFSSNFKLTMLDKLLLFGCVIILPQAKSVYFPLIFLVLFIPKSQWSKRASYWLWAGSALVLSTISFGIWSKLTADVAASNGLVRGDYAWKYGFAKVQEQFILRHPFGFLHAIVDSFFYQSKFYMDTYFGWLGFTYLQIPGAAEVAGFLAIGMSVLLAGKVKLRKYMPSVLAGSLLLNSLLIFAVLYIAFTVPMNTIVEGVQGRYFLPLTVLGIATIASFFPNLRITDEGKDNAKYLLVALSTFCLLFSAYRYGLAISV